MKEATVFPLDHNCFPVVASNAYKTAGTERFARSAADIADSPGGWNSPLEAANTMPLTTMGGTGEIISGETHPCASDSFPLSSTTFRATTPPFVTSAVLPANGSRIQVVSASCQLAKAAGA